eukprot:scaffold118713_cov69-Phaeocystis_antarctica.AAC.4
MTNCAFQTKKGGVAFRTATGKCNAKKKPPAKKAAPAAKKAKAPARKAKAPAAPPQRTGRSTRSGRYM